MPKCRAMQYTRSRYLVVLYLLTLPTALLLSQTVYKAELAPYVDFLRNQNTSAKNYILRLFRTHDIVIICERAHPDITQYDLFLAIVSDTTFVKSVGNIFTEIGTVTQAASVNEFVHNEGLSTDVVNQSIIQFQRNCSWYPIWENYNYSYFVRGIYSLNQKLNGHQKVNLFNCDVALDWSTASDSTIKELWAHAGVRDSIMAQTVITQFNRLSASSSDRHKALVIMNYRHAFGHSFEYPPGVKPRNVGRYLFDEYGNRVANVYLNFVALRDVRSDNDMSFAPIQNGKWDAAFKVLKIKDAGFDFRNSPFGKDTFDLWPMKVNLTYEQVFNGLAFYLPLEEQRYVIGMPGFVDSTFAQELKRRFALFASLPGGRFKPLEDVGGLMHDMNTSRERSIELLDSLTTRINKWLQQ